MLIIVFSTYLRFFGILFVVQPVSKLIMTIIKMLGSATTFIFICIGYLLMMLSIYMTLFRESSIAYSDNFNTFRTMFDALMATY